MKIKKLFEKRFASKSILFSDPILFAIALSIIIIIPLELAGCRLGNREEAAPQSASYTGVYVTLPKSLTLSVRVDGKEEQAPLDLGMIPKLITQFLTNPVFFGEVDKATGLGGLASPKDTSKALPVYVASDGTLTFSGTTRPLPYFTDPECLSHLAITEKGALHKDSKVPSPAGNKLPLAGRLSLDVKVATVFEGSCQPTFDALAQCYNDATQCGGSDASEDEAIHEAVVAAFSPFITAKILDAADISKVTEYSYEVSYE